MTIKKKIVLFFVSIMVGLGFIFIILLFIGEKKTIIEVEGFEVEYKVTDRRITMEDNKVVVFHFKYPAAFEDLARIVLIDKSEKSQIIKARKVKR